MIKGVIFDLDGVIVSTAWMHFEAWKDMTKLLKIDIKEDYEKDLRGVSREKCLQKILTDFNIDLNTTKYSFKNLTRF